MGGIQYPDRDPLRVLGGGTFSRAGNTSALCTYEIAAHVMITQLAE